MNNGIPFPSSESNALVDGEKDEVGVVRCVAEGEDLVVDLFEGVLVDDAGRTVLLESAVQATDLHCDGRERLGLLQDIA